MGLSAPARGTGFIWPISQAISGFFPFYALGRIANGAALSGTAGLPPIDNIEAVAFMVARNCTVSGLSVRVSTAAAGGKARVGLYSALASGLPGALLVDGGEFPTTAIGQQNSPNAISVPLLAGNIYWAAILQGVLAASFSAIPVAELWCGVLGGLDTSLDSAPRTKVRAAQAYGALPANFPALSAVGGLMASIFAKFSA